MTEQTNKAIMRALDACRRKLLDTGTRNRLIHVNRANQRANCLNIINEKTDEIYSILRIKARRMRFKAMGSDKTADGDDMVLALPDTEITDESGRLTDNFIETPLGPEALARRLLRMAGNAKTAEEEQGLNILYLAMGFLSWKESSSSGIQRDAPLVLLPVQLTRNQKTSTFDILCRDDDITTNLPLQERLKQDFGIILPDVGESEDWLPSQYIAQVHDVISSQSGWSIDEDGMQIGFFSFAKLLMHHDLSPNNWPDDMFSSSPLLNGLLAAGFPEDTSLFGADDKLDDLLDPAEIIQVIDADASQTKVIEEVRHGSNLVVEGPPGTGKSQTITNLIAAAVHDGKSVLFVAEKMAALSVVYSRLVNTGLKDICLELHSKAANKKALAQEIGRTLMASAKSLSDPSDPDQLRKARDELNRISKVLHEPLPNGSDTPFLAISEIIGFIGKDTPPPSIDLTVLESLGPTERSAALKAVDKLVESLECAGPPTSHPFRGTMTLDLQPPDLTRLKNELLKSISMIDDLIKKNEPMMRSLHQQAPESFAAAQQACSFLEVLSNAPDGAASLASTLLEHSEETRLRESLEAGVKWAEAKAKAAQHFVDAAWKTDVSAMRMAIARGKASWLSRLFGEYRKASSELADLLSGTLPKSPDARLRLIDDLLHVQTLRHALADEEPWLQNTLGPEWRGERTPFATILTVAHWLENAGGNTRFSSADQISDALNAFSEPAAIAKELSEQIEQTIATCRTPLNRLDLNLLQAGFAPNLENTMLTELREFLSNMASDVSRYNEWAGLQQAIRVAERQNAGSIVEAIRKDRLAPNQAKDEFSYACAEARWALARTLRPELDNLFQLDRHEIVQLFNSFEKDRIEETKTLILSRHFRQIPKGTMGEMGIIRGEIGRKRGHKPIRWMMKNAGSMLQRIKPVMLMSPISVAQFLPPGSVTFDLLVVDEASQIKPEDAIGTIARAHQIVVVGDQKQLPPTSFFDRLVDDEEDNDDDEENNIVGATAADMESILSLCETRGIRQQMLEWHYRSRDPSLIRVSNAEFYEDNLVLPPSPLERDNDYGLKFRQVPGVYARGGSGLGRQGTNRIEAEEVVKSVAEHARKHPDLSLGIVAFSKAQAHMLTEVLEIHRRKDSVLNEFLREGKTEDVFVKNIENVQGDERDVIMISVGYGPQEPNGRLTAMNFGPVNSEGGERRLNVLFSRSRMRCEVFASFSPGDIDPSRSTRDGPRVLKRFLDFAKTGIMDTPSATGLDADSPFEEDVAQVIRSLGYTADPQVGSAGFRIDIGVRHPDRPGQYLVAVECDGATYHSALWARERDRLRQSILENLGWHFHRIWSTDWFHDRSREIERLKASLKSARIKAADGIQVTGSNAESADTSVELEEESKNLNALDIEHLSMQSPPYIRADFTVESSVQPHEVSVGDLAEVVIRIVEIEGPIHENEIARRVASAFGLLRAGKRIVEATNRAIDAIVNVRDGFNKQGAFVLTAGQVENPPVRNRSAETGNLLRAEYLSPTEISAARRQITAESGEMEPEEMTKAIARLLGYQRVGPDLSEVIMNVLID